jgi:hypothetical protein
LSRFIYDASSQTSSIIARHVTPASGRNDDDRNVAIN